MRKLWCGNAPGLGQLLRAARGLPGAVTPEGDVTASSFVQRILGFFRKLC